jgi:formylglycine-generating enzyme required for sulfatase activity
MDADEITADVVRDALWSVRYAKPLRDNPLLQMEPVTVRLRDEDVADTPQARAWELSRLLDEVVRRELERLRRASGAPSTPGETTEQQLEALQSDFQVGNLDLEAVSYVFHRYLADDRTPVGEVADTLDVVHKTLHRRLGRGHELLVDALRKLEFTARPKAAHLPGAPARERVVISEQAKATAVAEADDPPRVMARLLSTIRSDDAVLQLTRDEAEAAVRHPVADLIEYRLGRVAAWTQPRYRLHERFVELALLTDQGEESVQGRWQAQEKRYSDLQDVIAETADPALVVLGSPGTGKSTILRRLELDMAIEGLRESDRAVTFFIQLNQHKADRPGAWPPPPREWLSDRWAARFPALQPMEDLLASGRMVLLLDGLNEIPHSGFGEYRERVTQWKQFIQEIAAEGRGNRVILSCRSLDYSTPLSTPRLRVPQVRIEPMTDEQVRRFLAVYHPAMAGALWSRLEGTAQLDLVRTAYFARLLVEQTEESGDVPEGRAALFTGFVRRALGREIERENAFFAPDGLLTERDYKRIVAAKKWKTPWELPERGVLFPRLARLAYEMQAAGGAGETSQLCIDYDEALKTLDHDRADDIVSAGVDLGVLDEDRNEDEIFFFHQLQQEYFAARRLATLSEPERVRTEWRSGKLSPTLDQVIDSLDPADGLAPLPQTGWEETTLLAAAMAKEPTPFVAVLMDANLVLAGRCAALPEVQSRLAEAFLNELRWVLVTRSRDPEADLRERIALGLALGDLGDPRFERRQGPYGEHLMPPFIEIPAGTYPVGDDEPLDCPGPRPGASGVDTDHVPRHEVAIAPFRIGQFPVTNAEWAYFMEAGGYDDERWWETPEARRWQRGELASEGSKLNNRVWRERFRAERELFELAVEGGVLSDESAIERWRNWIELDDDAFECALDAHWRPKRRAGPKFWQDDRYNNASQPVVGVCWYEARAFCSWLSAQTSLPIRLPTEVEWEAAARGRDARVYPWGGEFDRLRANTYETHVRRTTPVGVLPDGDTPEGVADLAGNVFDWTSSLWGEWQTEGAEVTYRYPYDPGDGREEIGAPSSVSRVVRGGSWLNDHTSARAACRSHYLLGPDGANNDRGLRLATTGFR